MKGDNIFKDYTFEQLQAIRKIIPNFYYGKALKIKSIRKHYKRVLDNMKNDLEEALEEKNEKENSGVCITVTKKDLEGEGFNECLRPETELRFPDEFEL